jgi:hypothetical protein
LPVKSSPAANAPALSVNLSRFISCIRGAHFVLWNTDALTLLAAPTFALASPPPRKLLEHGKEKFHSQIS